MKDNLDVQAIINDYKNGMGAEKIGLKYHVGKIKIKNILVENGITLKKRGGQTQNINYIVSDWKIEKYPAIEGCYYVAIFNEDGKEFCDHMNQGGYLTSYIKEKVGTEIPTLYDRRKYYMETGNYWWEQWFRIEKRENKPTKKCPYCDWETEDISNRTGAFGRHLCVTHQIDIKKHISIYPEDITYFNTYAKKIEKEKNLSDERNYIICPLCGEKLERMTMWHLKSKHNLSTKEFKKMFPNFTMLSEKAYEQSSEAFKEANLHVSKNKFISRYEHEIGNFLTEYNVTFESSRQFLIGKEIDILIPDKKIGIEFNGLKWHTEWFGKKERNYHLNKTILSNEKGYGLIHIFEDEYVNHKEIVYSKISHILQLHSNLPVIGGRQCIVREIYKHEAEKFLNENHIQGFTTATLYLGAFHKDKLVAVMNFKYGNLKNKSWDLNRFATNINYRCPGVGKKMFQYFIKNYNPLKVISFADRRWTVDPYCNLYIKLGFKIESFSKPDYRYYNEIVDKYKRFHKMGFNKKSLNRKYGFPMEMTETEMVKELGYDRIWDCGLIKYIWEQ